MKPTRQDLNLPYALAAKLKVPPHLFEDAVAEGLLAVFESAARFDPAMGAQFSTFAYYRVKGAILDFVRRSLREYSKTDARACMAHDRRPDPFAAAALNTVGSRAKASDVEMLRHVFVEGHPVCSLRKSRSHASIALKTAVRRVAALTSKPPRRPKAQVP